MTGIIKSNGQLRGDRCIALAAVMMALTLAPLHVHAQVARDSSVDWLLSAGSEAERYLRTLQVAGLSSNTQWTIRPFSGGAAARMLRTDAPHPWRDRFHARPSRRLWIRAVQPEVGGIINSTFPVGFNDGPVWAGRGLTAIASAGLQAVVGPLEFAIAPQVFRAQNASFPLAANGRTGPQSFADAIYATIDLPQRFGDGSYQRLDPGQSTARLTLLRVSVGISTANEVWGPGIESPFLLGNNAAGFAHAFAGTDGPVHVGSLRLNVRFIAGKLQQSPYSLAGADSSRRYMTGVVISGGISELPGLEIGFGRLFQNAWPDSGVGVGTVLGQLIKNPFKKQLAQTVGDGGSEPDNQLGSLFARWVFPTSGVELYGELGREDNSYDLRDVVLEPDHDLAYMLGLQRVWRQPSGSLLSVRGEILNTRVTHLQKVRDQSPPYIHSPIVQGHTQIGQVLGAPAGYAGGSTSLALDWFTSRGRATASLRRAMREPPGAFASSKDVEHSLAVDGMLFHRRIDLAPELMLTWNQNRNGLDDAFNARVSMVGRAHW